MAASWRAPNNRFRSLGLAPGLPLRLEVISECGPRMLATRIEDVDERQLAVLVPMYRTQECVLEPGLRVVGAYAYRGRQFRFSSESLGADTRGTLQLLAMPSAIDASDRRRSYRLEATIRPQAVWRLLVDPAREREPGGLIVRALVTDISEGGLCLTTRARVSRGEWLGVHLDLPHAGEIRARVRAVAVEGPPRGRRNYRVHCAFQNMGLADQARIARFVIRRQLEMRREGQL